MQRAHVRGEHVQRQHRRFNGSTDAKAAVDWWIGSSGHHANMVNCAFVDTGVGVSDNYAVQVFGTPA
ncbi:CAP domain-containing protein [Streptomyces sp. HUAS TT3]|uniref:CAP domain-containing protein n=1 Tax=Streptomyces sp. HUAS TT3 TaxID=3447510 RepID=UPI003F65C18B